MASAMEALVMKFLGEKKVIRSSSGQQISRHDVSKDSGQSRSTDSMCARCRRLDVPRLFAEYTFSPNITYHNVKSVGFVGTPRSWDSSGCDLCSMFHSMLATIKTASLDDFFSLEDTPFHLLVWNADCVFDIEFANDQNLLFIAPEYLCGPSGLYDDDFEARTDWIREIGFIGCKSMPDGLPKNSNQAYLQPRRIDPLLNLRLIRSWLGCCNNEHHCLDQSGTLFNGNLNLINCVSRSLERRPLYYQKYATLSYVWGSESPALNPSVGILPFTMTARLEPVIEDAMEVCKGLRIKYLWVDRYCISQDKDNAHQEISNMDTIYAKSYLTIIAAAGEDPSYGLTGISRKRTPQPQARIGELVLLSTQGSPEVLAENSVWNRRGWTYQEKLLSRRNLVFTDSQVYFECQNSRVQESIEYFPEKASFGLQNTLLCAQTNNTLISNIHPTTLIEQYTKRQLSYPEDALKAILGIFKACGKRRYKAVLHYWGIPTTLTTSDHISGAVFFRNLFWSTKRPSKRRDSFPSWSWTGWYGPIKYSLPEYRLDYGFRDNHHLHNDFSDVQIDVEDGSGKVLPWDEFHGCLEDGDSRTFTRFLDITAPIVTLKFFFHPRGPWKYCLQRPNQSSGSSSFLGYLSSFLTALGSFLTSLRWITYLDLMEVCINYDTYIIGRVLEPFSFMTSPKWITVLELMKEVNEGDELHHRLLSGECKGILIFNQRTRWQYCLVVDRIGECWELIGRLHAIRTRIGSENVASYKDHIVHRREAGAPFNWKAISIQTIRLG